MADDWNDYLVSFDTDRIKDYLFATNRLKEIRGASALLASLDQQRSDGLDKKFGKSAVVYSAGGGASVLLEDPKQATRLIEDIEKNFREETKTASITGVSIAPEEKVSGAQGSTTERKFGERMKKAAEELSRRKSRKAELAFIPVESYFRLCDSCGQHPTAGRAQDGSGDLLCASCLIKRDLGHKERSRLFDEFIKYTKDPIWDDAKLPEDLNELGRISHPPNYVGFIALDGNNMGQLLEKMRTKENYRTYSDELAELVKAITFVALQKCGCRPRSNKAPFEIVLIGGDDVMLFTAADIAVPVTQFILAEFEKRSPHLMKAVGLTNEREKLTMSAGVVLAHANYPIPALHAIAEQLLKSAKRYCAEKKAEKKYECSALDFEVISGGGASLETAREGVPHCRPYDLQEINRLLDHIVEMKKANFPTSQLHAMYQPLFEDSSTPGVMATLRVLGRIKDDYRKPLCEFFKDAKFVPPPGKPMMLPWSIFDEEKKSNCRSPLVDLVDLYPFIETQKEDSNDAAHTH